MADKWAGTAGFASMLMQMQALPADIPSFSGLYSQHGLVDSVDKPRFDCLRRQTEDLPSVRFRRVG